MRKFVTGASTVIWHPRVLWVGIGCQSGTSQQLMETAIQQVFRDNQLAESAIAGIATIDIKSDEVGLVELCRKWDLPLKTFPSDVLRIVSVPNPSQVVEKEVGTPSVAEAAALCAAKEFKIQNSKFKIPDPLLVPKQIFRSSIQNLKGAVTVAVAQAEKEYTGCTGQLLLVGTGLCLAYFSTQLFSEDS